MNGWKTTLKLICQWTNIYIYYLLYINIIINQNYNVHIY